MADFWIKDAIKHPGALRKKAKVKKDEKIPMSWLQQKALGKGTTGRQARLAITLRGMKK